MSTRPVRPWRTLMVVAIGLGLRPGAVPMAKGQGPETRGPSTPRLMVSGEGGSPGTALPVAEARVEASISGLLARTTTTLTFRNDQDRPLEGELVFPLPEGATVSGYALDVNGQMVDGVVVEQQAARVAFEAETRRRVDPGLVEWVRGNSFRTRVWPVPARGTRTVRVSYVSELSTRGAGLTREALYAVPLHYEGRLERLAVRVEVATGAAAPEIRAGGSLGLRFDRSEQRYVAEASRSAVEADQDLLVALPGLPERSVAVEADDDGRFYFVIDDLPEPPPATAAPRIRRVGVLWDASLSRARADTARERALLGRWLASLGEVSVALTVFRNVPEATRRFDLHRGDPGPLLAEIEGTAYDGGTDLARLPLDERVDCFVLFSDGLSTLSDARPAKAAAPVYAISSGVAADPAWLRRLAEASGGAYVDLGRTGEDEALRLLGTPPFSLLSVEVSPEAAADVLPALPRPVSGRATVSGRLLAAEAPVTLRYGRGGQVTSSRTFMARRAEAIHAGLVSRFWAQQKAAELALDPDRHQELIALARRHGLVTPGTSLLVLETVEQYLAHGIEPPRSRPAMREEYLRLAAQRKRARQEQAADKRAHVAALWRDRVEWWTRDFVAWPAPAADVKAAPVPVPVPAARASASPALVAAPAGRCTNQTGEIRGAVRDTSGAVIPGTTVTAVNGATGLVVSIVTDASGLYRICGLSPGTYRLRAELPGFIAQKHESLRVPAAAVLQWDVVLQVGGTQEAVTVTAEAPAVEASRTIATSSSSAGTRDASTIEVPPWDPATPYLAALESAPIGEAYTAYLAQRREFGTSPAFFLDCADFFQRHGQRPLALRILTSVVELRLDEPRLLRVAAHRLQQMGEQDLAIVLFEKVAQLRPEEPQSPRDLALALADRADRPGAARHRRQRARDYLRALALLDQVVMGDWDTRFDGIEAIALMEANRIAGILQREQLARGRAIPLDRAFRRRLDVDLRIVLTWDADLVDLDLWVTEPSGERCFFSHPLTARGGRLSHDFTGGYGPEEYVLHHARPGRYLVQADYYGSREVSFTGPTTLQATLITDFGRPGERRQSLTVRLSPENGLVDIGTARFESPGRR